MSTVAAELTAAIFDDAYFYELFHSLENAVANRFFQNTDAKVSESSIEDLLRYADILSHSEDFMARNIAYKIIALILDYDSLLTSEHRVYAEAVLTKLGNFPGLKFLHDTRPEKIILPIERELEKGLKMINQRTVDGQFIFTDAQFLARKGISEYDFFSFSGPTSIGKSFIIKDYIKELINSPQMTDGCIVVMVPTRALITQVINELRDDIEDKTINISAYPNYSPYVRKTYNKSIFVFTPERLLSYVANDNVDIRYLFVDEAQKIVSENDSRSSLYYHAIYETIRKFATKLVFASPNIPNPDIFLNIFEKDQRGSLSIREQTVAQNRYYVDLLARKVTYFSELEEGDVDNSIDFAQLPKTLNELLVMLGADVNNLIYCNGTAETVKRACDFASSLPPVELTKKLKELTSYLAEHIHEEYYLIECLKKGVAFHHGRMPQHVRMRVEEYYKDKESELRYLFCTSTLLEGVNLPAKNIFIANEYHGTSKFKKIDFENLIGRAGRLTKEFAGNVICVRDRDMRWKDEGELIKKTNLKPVDSFLVNPKKAKNKEFKNIAKILSGKPMAQMNVGEAENLNHYASIMLLHHMDNEGSLLKSGFLFKAKGAQQLLQVAKRDNNVPSDIIRASSIIKPSFQNKALDFIRGYGDRAALPKFSKDYDVEKVLSVFYDIYSWETEESSSKYPLIPKALIEKYQNGKGRLSYWAMLMKHWMAGEPLNVIIANSIRYHAGKGYIWLRQEDGKMVQEQFVSNRQQINAIIEEVMNDIENGIRFKIHKYLLNYYLLCSFQLGEEKAGHNWAEIIEYGTSDRKCIELQNIGLSRAAAMHVVDTLSKYLVFNERQELVDIDKVGMSGALNDEDSYKEEILAAIS